MGVDELDDLTEERPYDFEMIGNFGRFVSGSSYPIEYFMTSMSMAEAFRYLKFARDIQMDEINFDMLMQRDIDEERVESQIMTYLDSNETIASTRPVFFPPLLAAVVPISNDRLQEYYGKKDMQGTEEHPEVVWENNFRVLGKSTTNVDGIGIQMDGGSPKIKAKIAVLSLRTTDMNPESGVMLVVIDGQHRLMALKRLWKEHKGKVHDLIVPVCVLYPPNSHLGIEDRANTPTIPRVFRNLFVDVNSTMKVVGGHFNILLSDSKISDIACRMFCDSVLEVYGREGLAAVEWNTRSKKDSFNVNKKSSITSVGIIQKCMDGNFKPDMLIYYLLNITDASSDLFPEGASAEDYFPKIKWDKFSYAQSSAIRARVKKHLVPLMMQLFFESSPFKTLLDILNSEFEKLRAEAKSGGKAGLAAQAVLKELLDYKPIDESEEMFRLRLLNFGEAIETKRKAAGLDTLRYALFQRGLFNAAAFFIRAGLRYTLSPQKAFSGFVALVNFIFEKDPSVYNYSNSYMQYTAFSQHRILAREDTRAAFRDLTLSHMLRDDVRGAVLSAMGDTLPQAEKSELNEYLKDVAFEAAGEFLGRFREEREKAFRKNYELDYSLSQSEREELKLKELEQRALERKVKDGDIAESEVSRDFEVVVNTYIEEYFIEAKSDLRKALGIQSDLLEMGKDQEDEEDGSEES